MSLPLCRIAIHTYTDNILLSIRLSCRSLSDAVILRGVSRRARTGMKVEQLLFPLPLKEDCTPAWRAALGWPPGAHPAALSLPLHSKAGGENQMKKAVG